MATKQKQPRRLKRKRRYGALTDSDLLFAIAVEAFEVDTANGIVYSLARGQRRQLATTTCHRGYSFVRIYWSGAQRKVAVHKLVWMAANRQVVPDGHQIHHGPAGKQVNGIGNLLLKDAVEHGWYHEWKAYRQRTFPTYQEFREWKKAQAVETGGGKW